MKTSKLLYLLSGVIVATLLIYSCKDDFSEKDFLEMQADQAATNHQYSMDQILYQAQLARSSDSAMAVLQNMLSVELMMMQDSIKYRDALNQMRNAGLLLSWTIQIQENRKALDSVQVDIQTADLDNARTLSGVTDANGYVTFTDVTVGRNLVRISKSGYMTANVAVEFSMNQIQTTYVAGTYSTVVIRRQESSILPVFSNSTGSVATIWGNVTADFDLTNKTAEAAIGTTVRADISNTLQDKRLIYPDDNPQQTNSSNPTDGSNDYVQERTQRILTYSVEGGPNVGIATVDSTGHYKLIVPALSDGMCVGIIWQSFKHDVWQAMRWDENTGMPLDSPQWVSVSRFFGPDAGNTAPVQFVPGAWATFPDPTGSGSGFALDFAAQARDLGTWTAGTLGDGPGDINNNTGSPSEDGFDEQEVMYMLQNAGAGFTTAAPTFTLSGGGATTQATLVANMVGQINSITVTNGGAYGANIYPFFEVYVIMSGDTFQIASFQLDSIVGGGALSTGALNFLTDFVSLNDGDNVTTANRNGIDNTGAGTHTFYTRDLTSGFTHDGTSFASTTTAAPDPNNGVVTGIFIRSVNGTTPATLSLGATMQIDALTMTDGGAGYTSAPTITGAGGTTAPVLTITRYSSYYTLTVNNTNTSAYSILPDVEIFYQPFLRIPGSLTWTEDNDVTFDIANANQTETDDVNNKLRIDSNGDLVFYAPYTFRTQNRSVGVPYSLVKQIPTQKAVAFPWVDTDGKITSMATSSAPAHNGQGYTSIFGATISPTISGAPGSGAVVELLGFTTSATTGEVSWSGNYKITNPGSGYKQSLNFPFETFLDGLGSGLLHQVTRDDMEDPLWLMPGRSSTLPAMDNYGCSITVYPGDVYEVDGYYGSGALGAGKEQGVSIYPGFNGFGSW